MRTLEKLCDLLFELSNESRFGILRALSLKPLKLTEVSKTLDATPQETSRNLHRLAEQSLLERRPDGCYTLTPYGRYCLGQLDGLDFLTRNAEYFLSHTLMDIPVKFRHRIGALRKARLVSDVMKMFNDTKKMIGDAEERVWIMSDQVLMSTLPALHEAVERGVEFRLIMPIDFDPPSDFEEHIERSAWTRRSFDRKSLKSFRCLIVLTEKEAQVTFKTKEGRIDYLGFSVEDMEGLNWCSDFFTWCWDEAEACPQ